MADSAAESSSAATAAEDMICDGVDPSEFLKLQPKKSILKMTAPKFTDSYLAELEKAKQHESFDSKEGRAHFDEMNIIATHHPIDKDYGHMKIEEPKTPYHYSDGESEADEVAPGEGLARPRRVSLVGPGIDAEKLVECLEGADVHQAQHLLPQEDSDEEDMSEEKKAKKSEFEKKRKMHYNEGAILKQHLALDDEEELDEAGDVNMGQ